jgi:hypothetical protein
MSQGHGPGPPRAASKSRAPSAARHRGAVRRSPQIGEDDGGGSDAEPSGRNQGHSSARPSPPPRVDGWRRGGSAPSRTPEAARSASRELRGGARRLARPVMAACLAAVAVVSVVQLAGRCGLQTALVFLLCGPTMRPNFWLFFGSAGQPPLRPADAPLPGARAQRPTACGAPARRPPPGWGPQGGDSGTGPATDEPAGGIGDDAGGAALVAGGGGALAVGGDSGGAAARRLTDHNPNGGLGEALPSTDWEPARSARLAVVAAPGSGTREAFESTPSPPAAGRGACPLPRQCATAATAAACPAASRGRRATRASAARRPASAARAAAPTASSACPAAAAPRARSAAVRAAPTASWRRARGAATSSLSAATRAQRPPAERRRPSALGALGAALYGIGCLCRLGSSRTVP